MYPELVHDRVQLPWEVTAVHGFLLKPRPLHDLRGSPCMDALLTSANAAALEEAARQIPKWAEAGELRRQLMGLPTLEFSVPPPLRSQDPWLLERLLLLYGTFASAYVHSIHERAIAVLPRTLSLPLYQLSKAVRRPPILSYCSCVLANWRLLETTRPLTIENLDVLQKYPGGNDADWFLKIHVYIEGSADQIVRALITAIGHAREHRLDLLTTALEAVAEGIERVSSAMLRLEEQCRPPVYYRELRPYFRSFQDVIYEGVKRKGEQAITLAGPTAAQSLMVPMIEKSLDISHGPSGLTQQLRKMVSYAPQAHRLFLARLPESTVRSLVIQNKRTSSLVESYNHCVEALLRFRASHMEYIRQYIIAHSDARMGTGGVPFLPLIRQLVRETRQALIL